jgi:tetratricopeptide (TPR) repeat protein
VTAIKINRLVPTLLFIGGLLLCRNGLSAESAKGLILRAIEMSNKNQNKESIKIFTTVLQNYRLDSKIMYEVYVGRGSSYGKCRMNKEALFDLNKAIKLNPEKSKAYNNRGCVYKYLGKKAAALADFAKAIKLDPTDAKPFYNRGLLYHKIKELSKAVHDYTNAIRLKNRNTLYYQERAKVYYLMKKYEEELSDRTMIIKLNPKDAEKYFDRAGTYDRLRDYRNSIKDYNVAIRLKPDSYSYYHMRGQAYRSSAFFEKALLDYNQAKELNPKSVYIYLGLASVKSSLGDYRGALEDIETANGLSSPSQSSFIMNSYFSVLLNMGNLKKALDVITMVKEENYSPYDFHHRGIIKYYLGRHKDATKDFKISSQKNPKALYTMLFLWVMDKHNGDNADNRLNEYSIKHPPVYVVWQVLLNFYLNKIDGDKVIKKIKFKNKGYQDTIRSIACFFIGKKHQMEGQKKKAKIYLKKCIEYNRQSLIFHGMAKQELAHLE